MAGFRIEALANSHSRDGFDSGSPALNDYLARQVRQDVRRRITTCFVAIESATGRLAGYYTLSAGSVSLVDLPQSVAKKLPRYPVIPVVRIGRLAIDRSFQGRGLGSALLFDALKRSIETDIGVFAALVDAKDENAASFYERHGFQRIVSKENALFLPMSDALKRLING